METTLCYIENNNKYLMLYRNKKEIDINKGKWIGVGGKVEVNETIEDCLIREVYEETNLKLINYIYRAKIEFISNLAQENETMHLFTSDKYAGNIKNCNEGTLKWIDKDKILDLNLWDGDRIFLELLEKNNNFFELKLIYNNDNLVEAFLNKERVI